MLLLEPKRLEERLIKLQQQNKRLLMENKILNISYLKIDDLWDFDLDAKYIKCKKIKGNIYLNLNHIPSWIKDIEIEGSFSCTWCNLNSLKNSPKNISGSFDCSFNNLTSLKYSPKNVGNSYYNYGNDVKFTKEYVTSICNVNGYIFV